jgi:Phosphoenolpyruvate phosphomutase
VRAIDDTGILHGPDHPIRFRDLAIRSSRLAELTSHALTVAISSSVKSRSMATSRARMAGVAASSRRRPLSLRVTWRMRPCLGVRVTLDQALSLQGCEDAVHCLGVVLQARARSAGSDGAPQAQLDLVPEALRRARAYLKAGADCVFPIALWEREALAAFTARAPGPVNILALPRAPSVAQLAELGVARISYASFLHRAAMEQFSRALEPLAATARGLRQADHA